MTSRLLVEQSNEIFSVHTHLADTQINAGMLQWTTCTTCWLGFAEHDLHAVGMLALDRVYAIGKALPCITFSHSFCLFDVQQEESDINVISMMMMMMKTNKALRFKMHLCRRTESGTPIRNTSWHLKEEEEIHYVHTASKGL